jgi:hypothetical protein
MSWVKRMNLFVLKATEAVVRPVSSTSPNQNLLENGHFQNAIISPKIWTTYEIVDRILYLNYSYLIKIYFLINEVVILKDILISL